MNTLIVKKRELAQVIESFLVDKQMQVQRALEVAEIMHVSQTRLTGEAYIHHPLNVALTVIREFRVYDVDIVCAALLHDVLEDQSGRLLEEYGEEDDEHEAVYVIERLFGHRVARAVKGLSTPEVIGSREAKNIFYKEHVRNAIQDSAVCIVKLADYYDNALHVEVVPENTREHYIHKYGPVLRDVWLPFLQNMPAEHILNPVKNEIIADIEKALSHFYPNT